MSTRLESDNELLDEIKEPDMYKVIMLNDNYSTMQFVIAVLMGIFKKSHEEAHKLMLQIHNEGSAIAGVYIHDIAVTKSTHANELAHKSGFPLKTKVLKE